MEGESGMRRDDLQRVLLISFALISFPGGNVMGAYGALRVFRHVLGQAFAGKFKFAGVGSSLVRLRGTTLRITRVGSIGRPAFGKPAESRCGLVVVRNRHQIVALLVKVLPGDTLGYRSEE